MRRQFGVRPTAPPVAARHSARMTRRTVVSGLMGLSAWATTGATLRPAAAERPVSFGLTPVFLDSDIKLLGALEAYLSSRLRQPVNLVKRRTYQEITALLLSEQLDAAWICGFPLIQYPSRLSLVAVPLYKGRPLYQSYLIVGATDDARSVEDLRGGVHAFSDPDSNSGFLVTRHLLTTMDEMPESFFERFFFTYGHRNVIRAVAAGLAQSGSVDGYVWDVVREIEPDLAAGTRVIRKSEPLGFPPIACSRKRQESPTIRAIADALITMGDDAQGRDLLSILRLDGFTAGDMDLFADIAAKYREVLAQA